MNNKEEIKTLKNSAVVGGSQIISIAIKMLQTKFIALYLGVSGIGIIQLLTSSLQIIKTFSSLGLGFSGVKDIAAAKGSKNELKIAKTFKSLKRWVLISGSLGVLITIIFSKKISLLTFGNHEYWQEISLLSLTILLNNITLSYSSLIRGLRKMKDYALINILSAFFTTLLVVPIYYFFKTKGIIPALIISAIIPLFLNFKYASKIQILKIKFSIKESLFGGLDMITLGIFTVVTALITQLTSYYVKISINVTQGIESVGFYSVSIALTITYMSIIFSSIAADYFPKISAINKDNKELNKALVLQTKIMLLLGTPMILAMFTFSEIIIELLYSKEFLGANSILMWMLLSVFLRLIGFPIGYVFLAKGQKLKFIFTQTLWNLTFFVFVFISQKYFKSLEAIGISFSLSYVISLIVNIILIKKTTNLKYDKQVLNLISIYLPSTLFFFYISNYENFEYILIFKICLFLILSSHCLYQLHKISAINLSKFKLF